jgi:hypothetical protein
MYHFEELAIETGEKRTSSRSRRARRGLGRRAARD